MSEQERGPLGGLRVPGGSGGTDPLGVPFQHDPLGGPAPSARSGRGSEEEVRASAVCAVGICDGSGWVIDDDGEARPCECRKRKIRRARTRGMQSTIPERYRGVSFDRPPISNMAADPGDGRGRARDPRLLREHRR